VRLRPAGRGGAAGGEGRASPPGRARPQPAGPVGAAAGIRRLEPGA
jgi:hypothetical protein